MKALYRKYRPVKISDVIGQPQVTKPLEGALKSGKISHSYLFTGPRGCGKTSVARIFAHEINNFEYKIEDNYVDIIEIDAASNTGVDNIRELREKAAIAPSKGKYKVYIIDEVHMLSKSAFNALLKTLEEPPKHVVFIMATTDAYKVPITITSRAQVYNFQLASPDVMMNHLKSIAQKENIKIEDVALEIIVRKGGGSFRDSISLLDQISTLSTPDKIISESDIENALGLPKEQIIKSLLDAYEQGKVAEITDLLKTSLNSGINPEILAENLIEAIIGSPKPEYLSLLEKLPEVKTPFPEAKILLAFIGNIAKTPAVAPKMAGEAPRTPVKPPMPKNLESTAPEPKSSPKTPKTALKTPNPANFNWDSYLENIKNTNSAIYSTLSKCTHSVENNQLVIHTERKIHKTILKSTNNLKVLQKFLPEGFSIEIVDASEDTKSSGKYSQISDIMGSVTEVGSDGVPF